VELHGIRLPAELVEHAVAMVANLQDANIDESRWAGID
jgi:hypothetical protein